MPECPRCGADGADIFLLSVYCPNRDCVHFDPITLERLSKRAKSAVDQFVKGLRDDEDTDPEIKLETD